MLLALLVLPSLLQLCCCQIGEQLVNPDFGQPFNGDGWEGNGADISQSTDAFTGVYSCHVSNT